MCKSNSQASSSTHGVTRLPGSVHSIITLSNNDHVVMSFRHTLIPLMTHCKDRVNVLMFILLSASSTSSSSSTSSLIPLISVTLWILRNVFVLSSWPYGNSVVVILLLLLTPYTWLMERINLTIAGWKTLITYYPWIEVGVVFYNITCTKPASYLIEEGHCMYGKSHCTVFSTVSI